MSAINALQGMGTQSTHASKTLGKDVNAQSDHFRLGAVRDLESERLQQLPNVKGVAIGTKEVGGVDTGDLALIVFVNKKLPLDHLKPADCIPKKLDPYKSGAPFPTDVIEWPDSDAESSDEDD